MVPTIPVSVEQVVISIVDDAHFDVLFFVARLRSPPNIFFRKRKTGGISITSVVPMTHMDEKMVQRILQVNWVRTVAGARFSYCSLFFVQWRVP